MSLHSLLPVVLLILTCTHGQYIPPQDHSKDIIPKPAEKPTQDEPEIAIGLTHDVPVVKIELNNNTAVNNNDQNDRNNNKVNQDQDNVNKKNQEIHKVEKNDKQETNKINKTVENVQQNRSNESHIKHSIMRQDVIQSGALMRGVIVFVVLSILILIYFGCRHYRLASGKTSTSVVHKYGVRTRRNDMEMLPLPLDEDEDDDTVFEVNHFK